MFRQFYAEQNMGDPRDSWYKPNLLYNIHYKPPKTPTPPKMVVVTKELNPSVCTCGEHDCVPHYRMEREVVWSNENARNETDRELRAKMEAEIYAKAQMENVVDTDDNLCSDDDEEDDDASSEDDEEWEMSNDIDTRNEGNDIDGLLKSLPLFDDITKQDKPEADVVHATSEPSVRLEEDNEDDFGSAFGIMSVYCDSQLHTWSWKNEFCCH